jgi:hypothetical protein
MRAQSLIAILAATIIGLTSGLGQAAAQPFQDLCARDVFQADGTLGSAPRKLEAASSLPLPQQCQAWRTHVGSLINARAVYARCAKPEIKARRLPSIDSDLADFRALLTSRCKGK